MVVHYTAFAHTPSPSSLSLLSFYSVLSIEKCVGNDTGCWLSVLCDNRYLFSSNDCSTLSETMGKSDLTAHVSGVFWHSTVSRIYYLAFCLYLCVSHGENVLPLVMVVANIFMVVQALKIK